MKNTPSLIAALLTASILTACGEPPPPFTEKQLVIGSKETIRIREIDLSITNNGCGRQWEGEAEKPYCELVIKYKDSTFTAGDSFKPVYVGTIRIAIDKMNPWGRVEDSVPPGGCRIIVTKLPDTAR